MNWTVGYICGKLLIVYRCHDNNRDENNYGDDNNYKSGKLDTSSYRGFEYGNNNNGIQFMVWMNGGFNNWYL